MEFEDYQMAKQEFNKEIGGFKTGYDLLFVLMNTLPENDLDKSLNFFPFKIWQWIENANFNKIFKKFMNSCIHLFSMRKLTFFFECFYSSLL